MTADARYECCDARRRNLVAAHPTLNGLDAIEVIDRDLDMADPLRQRTLLLFFLKPIAAAGFGRDNVTIRGGERVRDPAVEWADVASAPPPQLAQPGEAGVAARVAALAQPDHVLVVRVAETGDFSSYTLSVRRSRFDPSPPDHFDPRMVELAFSFKVECPSDFDCAATPCCTPEPEPAPEIDYLARDYASIRRLLLDRMAQVAPGWRETSPADLGITLVELLAYVGDQLSWRQDAIATEAYLATARRRTSLRRHAELVDYAMHDGCNARCFVQLQLAPGLATLALPRAQTRFLTRCDRLPRAIAAGSIDEGAALAQAPVVFEPMADTVLFADLDELSLHAWGDERCCLPAGATRATLRGTHVLAPGSWLLFEEVLGPRSGAAGDADPAHRQVVRIVAAWPAVDPLPTPTQAVTEIEWAAEDALRFPLCLTAVTDEEHGSVALADVSVARGNLVLADHGRTLAPESLGNVPRAHLFAPAACAGHCDPSTPTPLPVRYTPTLAEAPVTQAVPLDAEASASAVLLAAVERAIPQVALTGTLDAASQPWEPRRSLFNSPREDNGFVVEVEGDGRATLRFGDDAYGRRPEADTAFSATYRIGNGVDGNLGADALWHVVGVDVSGIASVRNPLPAVGGLEPETAESVRRRAPQAFRRQERAVTRADYSEVTARDPSIQRAASRLRWTGSWYTMFITVDRAGGAPLDAATRAALGTRLDGYRMAGHDIEWQDPAHVSLEIDLHVCVADDAFRADVRSRLLELFGTRVLAGGRRGLFHPDNFSFGQPVWLSPLIAAAHGVPGVASIDVTKFGRQGDDDPLPLADGVLRLGPREIARLDNDPNFPEHGVLVLDLHGGK